MPCTGPTQDWAKRDAKFVAPKLYELTRKAVEDRLTSYWHVRNTEKVLKELFREVWKVEKPGEEYNYHSYEYNRRKYMLIGFLSAKLPDKMYDHTESLRRIKHHSGEF